MRKLPAWWDWELELSLHLLERMTDRGFTEIEWRGILASATSIHRDPATGRRVVATRHRGRRWEIVLELDPDKRRLVVITAYPLTP